ncbi:MAG: hypothetical protein QXD62_02920 [Candidatus Woesearchaeota archaeon]
MNRKKGQIHILESVAIILFFIVILGLFFIFYSRLQVQKVEEKKHEDAVKILFDKFKILTSLDELKCTLIGVERKTCLDLVKIEQFSNSINSSDFVRSYYSSIFGSSSINITIIYSVDESYLNKSIILYDLKTTTKNSLFFEYPVSIYNPYRKKTYFGLVKYTYYYE